MDATLKSRELGSVNTLEKGREDYNISQDLLVRLEKWRRYPDLVTAAELVEIAIVDGNESEAVNAARRLVAIDSNATPLIRAHAAGLLKRTGHSEDVPTGVLKSVKPEAAYWRNLSRLNPQDALAWVELALHQTIRGHVEHAIKSMTIALHNAPHNRHVLRSAARLFLHKGDPEKAHGIIARSPATPKDPWLLAAEISLAELASKSPTFYKIGIRLMEDGGLIPRQISELAGAVGTKELLDGNRKKSKKMFLQSMLDPTGNALAQGEWATPNLGSDIVPPGSFSHVLEAHEARAFHFYITKNYIQVGGACEQWALVDPFSVRPYEFGSTAAAYAEDYEKSAEFAKRGLVLRSGSGYLLNSLVFALVSSGKLDEAEKYLMEIDVQKADQRLRLFTLANVGLITFRRGLFDDGLKIYSRVVDGFQKIGKPELSAHAYVYLAREVTIAALPNAKKYILEAQKQMLSYPTEALTVLRSVEKLAGMTTSKASQQETRTLSTVTAASEMPSFQQRLK